MAAAAVVTPGQGTGPVATTPGYDVEPITLHDQQTLVMRDTVDEEGIAPFMGAAFTRVAEVAQQDGMFVCGPPFARVRPEPGGEIDLEVGFPVSGMVLGQGDVKASHLPGGPALRTTHRGDYSRSREAHEALYAYAAQHGLAPAGDAWEVYLDEPDVAQPRTLVVLPTRTAADTG